MVRATVEGGTYGCAAASRRSRKCRVASSSLAGNWNRAMARPLQAMPQWPMPVSNTSYPSVIPLLYQAVDGPPMARGVPAKPVIDLGRQRITLGANEFEGRS